MTPLNCLKETEVKKTKVNIGNANKPISVIISGDKGNPLFAVGYSFPELAKEKKDKEEPNAS